MRDSQPWDGSGTDLCRELLQCLGTLDYAGVKQVGWRDFEFYCAKVLEENGYRTFGSIWFSAQGKRHQIDVVGALLKRVLCIDCKAWASGGGRHRAKMAAELQKERTMGLKRFARVPGLRSGPEVRFYPLVVTLRSEDIRVHQGVAVVPFQMLNAFILRFDLYEDRLFSV